MTKIEHDTVKFYPSYPVFVLMARIGGEVYATTYSSSYSLRDVMVIGVGNDERTASALAVGQAVSLNFLRANDEGGLISDICGNISGRQRLEFLAKAGIAAGEIDGVPTLPAAHVTMLGEVRQLVDEGNYHSEVPTIRHIFIKITRRFVDERLFEAGKIDWGRFEQLEYAGDGDIRVYQPGNRPNDDYWKAERARLKEIRAAERAAQTQGGTDGSD